MKTPRRPLSTLSALPLLCFVVGASAVTTIAMPISNIISNGGFETGSLPPWQVSGSTAANTNAADNGAIGVDQDSAHSGDFGAFAGPVGSLGYLSQDLTTDGSGSYELSFWMDGNQSEASSAATAGHPVEFEVFWNGELLYRTFNPPTSYTEFTFTDLAVTDSITELKFGFRDDTGVFHLDDVAAGISRVPEAFSTLWLGLPLLLMFAFARFAQEKVQLRHNGQ